MLLSLPKKRWVLIDPGTALMAKANKEIRAMLAVVEWPPGKITVQLIELVLQRS